MFNINDMESIPLALICNGKTTEHFGTSTIFRFAFFVVGLARLVYAAVDVAAGFRIRAGNEDSFHAHGVKEVRTISVFRNAPCLPETLVSHSFLTIGLNRAQIIGGAHGVLSICQTD
jgi:hypothetical protein